jgi:hypothetical protein
LAPVIYGPEDKRADARTQFLATTFPTLVECVDWQHTVPSFHSITLNTSSPRRLNKILVAHGGVYFTGVGTTYADIAAFNFLDA